MRTATAVLLNLLLCASPCVAQEADWAEHSGSARLAEQGITALERSDYAAAASLFRGAAEAAHEDAPAARWRYRMQQAYALHLRGYQFGEPTHLREAVHVYETMTLPLVPRDSRPREWALTHRALGETLFRLGWLGDDAALVRSAQEHELALTELARDRDSVEWARTQAALGSVQLTLGERGDASMLLRSVAAFEAALEELTVERDPLGWATTQAMLGGALRSLGERGDAKALEASITAYGAALTVLRPEREATQWADAQVGLGNALGTHAQGDDAALSRSIAAYERALTVFAPHRDPSRWAMTQLNLGTVLRARGDLARSEGALRAALTVLTAKGNRAMWADVNFSLALTCLAQRRQGEARSAAQNALRGYEETNNAYRVREVRTFIARLGPTPEGLTTIALLIAAAVLGAIAARFSVRR